MAPSGSAGSAGEVRLTNDAHPRDATYVTCYLMR